MSGSGEIYRYSDASGHRAAYGSYFGFWYINWPLGQAATVSLAPHVSHSSSMDVYPRKFVRRVDRCIRTTAGITTSQDAKSFQSGFSVRKPPGAWILQYQQTGFSGAHGSQHLYYLVGGKVSEVDFLFARKLEEDLPTNSLRFFSSEFGIFCRLHCLSQRTNGESWIMPSIACPGRPFPGPFIGGFVTS